MLEFTYGVSPLTNQEVLDTGSNDWLGSWTWGKGLLGGGSIHSKKVPHFPNTQSQSNNPAFSFCYSALLNILRAQKRRRHNQQHFQARLLRNTTYWALFRFLVV
ncbi:unnamed protein product, partial [Linum tenue]